MGKVFDALTKTGLQSPGGTTQFYNSPADAMNQANAALSKAPSPQMVTAQPTNVQVSPGAPSPLPDGQTGPPEQGPPQLATSGGGPQFTTPQTNLPTVVKPSWPTC